MVSCYYLPNCLRFTLCMMAAPDPLHNPIDKYKCHIYYTSIVVCTVTGKITLATTLEVISLLYQFITVPNTTI